ncbi:estradiol 17-beta-dehydrogenase 8-like [Physella acuta]|uniref:estradiol 17-beta-dehydrogenase 8-like n=1 Tax=Physella acuta TaxID=109671 RepID=UPI0027DD0218|nr:estradiol 17-beta-dehydrogenase 8-like [Physella acuta]
MSSRNLLLTGRLALVTGGGSGIGRAVCSVLAREGAKIAVVDLNKSSAQETVSSLPNSTHHEAFAANVACSAQVTSMLSQVEEKFKSVPTLAVNAAGITKDNFLLKLDEQAFDDVINVNLKGTFLINQAISRAMHRAKVEDGAIVNISSIVGKNGNIGQTNYAASKAGVIGFTKSAAKELARYNIRVNAILPGFIDTPMTDKVPENVLMMIKAMIPLKRTGTPEEIAEVCAFLLSARSSYITGTAIEVTGGLNF